MKILVVRPDAIGDMVLTLPLIQVLKKTYPNTVIDVLGQAHHKELLRHHPDIGDVVIGASWRALRKRNYTHAYLPFLTTQTALLTTLAGIPERIGDANQLIPSLFLTRKIPIDFRDIRLHEVAHNLKLFEGDTTLIEPIRLYTSEEEDNAVQERLAKFLDHSAYIYIHTSIGKGNLAWAPERFAELIKKFYRETEFKVILAGTQADVSRNAKISSLSDHLPIDLTGKLSLRELMSVIKLSSGVIGCDTGPTHIACAFQKPIVSLSTTKFIKPTRWGPWETSFEILGRDTPCTRVCKPVKSPCGQSGCPMPFSSERVFTAFKAALSQAMLSSADQQNKRASATLRIAVYGPNASNLVQSLRAESIQAEQVSFNRWNCVKWMRFLGQFDPNIIHILGKKPPILITVYSKLAALLQYVPAKVLAFSPEPSHPLLPQYLLQYGNANEQT